MSDKLNHFICPTCGHDFHASCAYATCDGCNTFFYASQSRTCQPPATATYSSEPPFYPKTISGRGR
jgi:hypothetical protein